MQITAPFPAPLRRFLPQKGGSWLPTALGAAGVLAVAGAGVFAYQQFVAPAEPVPLGQIVAVERGSIATAVNATGSIVPATRANLAFGASGRLKEINVTLGEQVQAGQVLAQLDTQALELRLEQSHSQLATAKLRLEQLIQGATAEEVAAAQAAYSAAAARHEQLLAGPASADLRAAEASLAQAQASYNQALARVQALEAGAGEADLASARAALESASNSLATSEARLEQLLAGPTPEELTAAQASVDQARGNVRSAEARLEQARANTSIPADLIAAQSSLASAESRLHAAHLALAAKDDELVQAQATLQAQRSSLESSQQQARETCETAGDGSAECAAARSRVDGIHPGLHAAEAKLQRLEGADSWEMKAAREEVLAAQSAYDAARARLEQAQVAHNVQTDLIAAQTAYESAVSSLATAEARLRTLAEGPTRLDLVTAETAVETARANLASAEVRLAAVTFSGPQEVESARAALRSAEAGLESARARLAQIREGATEADLESARSSVLSAQATLAQRSNASETEVALQMESVRQTELSVRQAQLDLEGATLVAPFDAVVATINGSPGEQVSGAFLTLVDPLDVRVDVSIDEIDIARLRVGQLARVTFDALPNETFAGRVIAVSPIGTVNQGVVSYPVSLSLDARPPGPQSASRGQMQARDQMPSQEELMQRLQERSAGQFQSRAQFPGQGQSEGRPAPEQAEPSAPRVLPAGLTASVSIIVEQQDDVLVVPSRAVRRVGTEQIVQVLGDDGALHERAVRTGVMSDQLIEIVDGLSEGEQVVIPAPTTLQPTGGAVPGLGGGRAGGFATPIR